MENVFKFRDELIDEYSSFSRSFVSIGAIDIKNLVEKEYIDGRYWPQPLIQINPNYQRKGTVQDLANSGVLHPLCADIFRTGKTEGKSDPLFLYKHQIEALAKGQEKQSFVVTTGTGSGKSLSFFIPVIDAILKGKEKDSKPRTRAIVIYPMNALANSQLEELEKFLVDFPASERPFTVARYTGQENSARREEIANNPPDILLTNFMMLELILTRYEDVDRRVVENCGGLEFLILDELHTYRGRQGADVAVLVRRLRERLTANSMTCIGTSATMSSTGKQADRNRVVADVSSKLFGTKISEHDVIGETLERVTTQSKDVASIKPLLRQEVERDFFTWSGFDEFKDSPLAIWVELNLGIEIPDDEPPKRAKPQTLKSASERLATDAGMSQEQATIALQKFLVAAHDIRTPQGRPPFAFKLHQFISGPGKVLATLEPEGTRTITLDAQRFAPGRQEQAVQLYPTHFCRDCGQEYHPVWKTTHGQIRFDPRDIGEITTADNEELNFGFLCPKKLTLAYKGGLEDLPEAWIDFSKSEPKLKPTYKKARPEEFTIDAQGIEGRGHRYWYIPGKFRFCLNCSQVHEAHGKDINRLASLSGEGRSSATTVLALSALQQLFSMEELPEGTPDPRKLLGFTDNRQDAALQAGHFNDFIFLLTLRAGLIGALKSNNLSLDEEKLSEEVFKSLGFDKVDEGTLAEYLKTPKLMGLARQEAQRTLRYIIGYRLIRDLRRGWRFNNPNLDQLSLLQIGYRGLEDFCAEEELFKNSKNSVLEKLNAFNRANLCKVLFDEMRRSLCLETRYLDSVEQDKARNSAFTYLNERWAFAPDEKLETSKFLILTKRPEYKGKPRTDLVSAAERSRVIKIIKTAEFWKSSSFAGQVSTWKDGEWVELVAALLELGTLYGYVQKHSVEKGLAGYRLNASAMEWRLTDSVAQEESTTNQYFRQLYLNLAELLKQPNHPLFFFEAQEHTAQVDAARRQLLEQRFRYTEKDQKEWLEEPGHETPLERLPVMFCSPTMELGVDISALNTVYLRNVPPTPANYAQRSGRAGRSGQQALVITYCASLSPHDQWFFHNANEMVHGVVKAPTLDLGNRELIESHLHAVWLAAAEIELDSSIAPMVNLEDEAKPLQPALMQKLADPNVIAKAREAAKGVIRQLESELSNSHWFTQDYIDSVINQAPSNFSQALDRWRALFDATRKQMDMAEAVAKSHTATDMERTNAKRRWGDAANQYGILLKTGNTQNSDFYTYRYLASQGFLPGYNFPRLPLMAWIPARGGQGAGKDDEGSMVSRPRFLALSEFGPRSLIYHQGRMYRVVRAKLNVGNSDHISGNSSLATITSRVCSQCGYGHLGQPGGEEPLVERCENCDALLTEADWVKELYRIETVETLPVERISINDEDRQRQGFELQTTYRFLPGPDGKIQQHKAIVESNEEPLAEITYAPAARIWRINRGWRRRKDKNQLGFYINPITGTWSKQDDPNSEDDNSNDESAMDKVANQRIVPFVEDHRNLLILQPTRLLSIETMATVQAALKRGIEMTFQIEESELVAEPLPKLDDRKSLLFYEAAEGGAGVLTRLASEPESLAMVASKALEIMHFQKPDDNWDISQLPALEKKDELGNALCEAGCYQCLLSYFNQPDHENINRRDRDALELLVTLANANVRQSSQIGSDAASNSMLDSHKTTGSAAEFLSTIEKNGFNKPDATMVTVAGGVAKAVAQYKSARTLIFTDWPNDETIQQLTDKGWTCLNASNSAQWESLFNEHSKLFNPEGRKEI
ncbi:DEAD/DEAH box helicase [Pokkaliibacter sp. CJK22405]|uniref:DEAD/DEAH box helicase n=1 Tax=Pokkaliibacter sp. CJK22405 TaxID=3384615 RepID=UPI0039855ED5